MRLCHSFAGGFDRDITAINLSHGTMVCNSLSHQSLLMMILRSFVDVGVDYCSTVHHPQVALCIVNGSGPRILPVRRCLEREN